MNRKTKIWIAVALSIPELALIAWAIIKTHRFPVLDGSEPTTLVGSVLSQDSDPTKQNPLPGATVRAVSAETGAEAKSDPSGFFSITLNPGVKKGRKVVLTFSSPNYKSEEITTTKPGDQLYIVRLQPLRRDHLMVASGAAVSSAVPAPSGVHASPKAVEIKNVRIRYSFKDESTISVGSLAKQFSAPNTGNEPCRGRVPCSPDGKWKATRTVLSLDADEGNQFSNIRVSCIAGPCAFTKLDPDHFAQPLRKITTSVLNWSDTTDFLVEADVSKSMVADVVRTSYPFIVGQTISFALPPTSEGPCIEADIDGQDTVFPLGPALIVSWGTCSLEKSPSGDKIYRCQSKPGYLLGS